VIGGAIIGQITISLRRYFYDHHLPFIFWIIAMLIANYICLSHLNHNRQVPFDRVYEGIEAGGLSLAFLIISLIRNNKVSESPKFQIKFQSKQIFMGIVIITLGLSGLAALASLGSRVKKTWAIINEEKIVMLPIIPFFVLEGTYTLIILWIEFAIPFFIQFFVKSFNTKHKGEMKKE